MKVYVVTMANEPNKSPCLPMLFATYAAATEYVARRMQEDWELNDPHDAEGQPLDFPGSWYAAHAMLLKFVGPEYRQWNVTSHDVPGTVTLLTRQQAVSLQRVYDRGPIYETPEHEAHNVAMSFEDWVTKNTSCEIGGPALMVQWQGMWLGIEPDGYTHS